MKDDTALVHRPVALDRPAVPAPPVPSTQVTEPTGGRRRWLRRGRSNVVVRRSLVAVLAAVTVVVVLDGLVAGVVFRQRQNQQGGDIRAPRPYTAVGRSIAVLQIPKLGQNLVVAEGTSASTLRGGPGHLATSAVPGAAGNAVVLGHRRHFGSPFGGLDKLKPGDQLFVQPKGTSDALSYIVSAVTTGGDELLAKLAPRDGVHLTLVTSAEGRLSSKRLVVEAEADAPLPRTPAAAKPAIAPTSFEPDSALMSGNTVLAFGWLAIGLSSLLALRRRSTRFVAFVVSAPPLCLALTMLWFEVDRWLPATL